MTNQDLNEQIARKLNPKFEIAYSTVTGLSNIPDYCGSLQAAWEIALKHPSNGHTQFELRFYWDGRGFHLRKRAICEAFLKLSTRNEMALCAVETAFI